MQNQAKAPDLVVRRIIGEPNGAGMVRVTVSRENFLGISQSINARFSRQTPKPEQVYSFEGAGTQDGAGVRRFDINGVEVYAYFKPFTEAEMSEENSRVEYLRERGVNIWPKKGKTFLFMKAEDAKEHLVSLEEERKNEPKAPFKVSDFDLTLVASARGEQSPDEEEGA